MTSQNKDLYILGTGLHAEVAVEVAQTLDDLGHIFLVSEGVTVFSREIGAASSCKVISDNDFASRALELGNCRFHIAIGDNRKRNFLAQRLSKEKLTPFTLVSPSATISPSATVGQGAFVGPNANVGAMSKVGNFATVNTLANLEHHSSLGDFSHLGPGACVCGNAHVGTGGFVGANSIIKEGCELGEWSTLGALSFLNRRHQVKGDTLFGIPAQSVRGNFARD